MDIPLASIRFEGESRLRQRYGDVPELALDILENGQLQDILVQPDEAESDFDYVLIDGGRRFLAFSALYGKNKTVPGVEAGCIGCKVREAETALRTKILEYKANAIREDFTWRETAIFIRLLHESMMELEPEIWSVKATGTAIGRSKEWIYKNLALTENDKIFNHKKFKDADSFVAAYRQFEILKDRARRTLEAAHMEKQVEAARAEAEKSGIALPDKGPLADAKSLDARAYKSVWPGDVRKWIKKQQDESFSWFHWDPPYGGEQSGGANPVHEEFDDTEQRAWGLVRDVLPEIHRTIKFGAWLAIWYHPQFYHRLMGILRGHSFSDGECERCGVGWDDIHIREICPESDTFFWVNPYPFVWYKANRGADAHEIRKYCVNAYETFLLACKAQGSAVILPRSNVQNVLVYPMPTPTKRQHVTHKPKEVLADILNIISVPGSRGGDGGTGSGSIFEAAFGTGRDCIGVELSETYYHTSLEAAKRGLKNWGGMI